MAFNTGNPVPSTDGRDLSDNAEIIDGFANSTAASINDRLGVPRRTLSKINSQVLELEAQYVFTAINSGVWAAGQIFTALNQYMVFSGTAYKPKNSTSLPYVVGASPVSDANVEVVGNLSTAQLINDISQAYEFDIVDDMTSSSIVFPLKKKFITKGNRAIGDGGAASYIYTSGDTSDGIVDHLVGANTAVFEGRVITSRQVGAQWDSSFNDTHAVDNYYRLNAMLSNARFNHVKYSNPLGTIISVTGSVNLTRSHVRVTHEEGSRVEGKFEIDGQPGDILNGGQLFGFAPIDFLTNPTARLESIIIDGKGEIETIFNAALPGDSSNNNNCYGGGKVFNMTIKEIKITGSDHSGINFDFLVNNVLIDNVVVENCMDEPIKIKNEENIDVAGTVDPRSVSRVINSRIVSSDWGGRNDEVAVVLSGGGLFIVDKCEIIDTGSVINPQGVLGRGADKIIVKNTLISGYKFGMRALRTLNSTMDNCTIEDCDYVVGGFADEEKVNSITVKDTTVKGALIAAVFSDNLVTEDVIKKVTLDNNDFTGVTTSWEWIDGPRVPAIINLTDNDANSIGAFTYAGGIHNLKTSSASIDGAVIDIRGDDGDFPYETAELFITQGADAYTAQFSLADSELTSSAFTVPLIRVSDNALTTVIATKSGNNITFSITDGGLGYAIAKVRLTNN